LPLTFAWREWLDNKTNSLLYDEALEDHTATISSGTLFDLKMEAVSSSRMLGFLSSACHYDQETHKPILFVLFIYTVVRSSNPASDVL
jgi:hypothetical protein